MVENVSPGGVRCNRGGPNLAPSRPRNRRMYAVAAALMANDWWYFW